MIRKLFGLMGLLVVGTTIGIVFLYSTIEMIHGSHEFALGLKIDSSLLIEEQPCKLLQPKFSMQSISILNRIQNFISEMNCEKIKSNGFLF